MTGGSCGDQNFESLFDQVDGVALWMSNEPSEPDYLSAGFEEIWGRPPEDIKDDLTQLTDAVHPEDRDRVQANIEAPPQEFHDQKYECRVMQPDGSVRWVLTQQVLLQDDDGGMLAAVGVCTDITDQKRREQELELLNRIVRHDIRNDMSLILGWAEMLETHVDDVGSQFLQKILTRGENIVELTKTAQNYVEIVTSNRDFSPESIPLRSVIKTEISLCEESFPDAEFVLDNMPPKIEVAADRMLGSVFRNVLSNAVQHNDKDTPRVEVSFVVRDDTIDVRIADNGPGIPDDCKDLVFEKGEQGLGSSGTGLGLYLVDILVSQYGGDILVENNNPTGAVFVLRLSRVD